MQPVSDTYFSAQHTRAVGKEETPSKDSTFVTVIFSWPRTPRDTECHSPRHSPLAGCHSMTLWRRWTE